MAGWAAVDGSSPEICSECGFDARHWRVRDAGTLFDELGYWWRMATVGVDHDQLNRRPAPAVWSTLEYGLHTSVVTAVIRSGIEAILAEDGCQLPAPPPLDPAGKATAVVLDAGGVVDALETEGKALAALADRPSPAWTNIGHLPDTTVQAEAALIHAAHDASHHFMDVGRGLEVIGAGTPAATGSVLQVNTSAGGVPKQSLGSSRATIGTRGIEGDVQADRKHHGRPFQALCLWSAEVIAELAAAGHPITAGAAGENLTLTGIDWATLRPGSRLRVGTALAELSYPAVPCQKQARWFSDGDFNRISHDRSPNWTRWYAWVREPGEVEPRDSVVLQPRRR
jgi:MOSC domain-containing protein YiiM